jgi:hypothetical protein
LARLEKPAPRSQPMTARARRRQAERGMQTSAPPADGPPIRKTRRVKKSR